MSCIVECIYYATDKKWVRIVGNITAIAIVFGVFFIHIQRLEKKATYQEVTVCGIVPEKHTGITSDGEILLFDEKIPTETLKEIKESYRDSVISFKMVKNPFDFEKKEKMVFDIKLP
jgi:hypothetical protein